MSSHLRPVYADSFRCIGSDCEDTCCHGWSIPIDRGAWEKYQQLPDVPLASLIRSTMEAQPANADGSEPVPFAKVRMNEANQCPLLTEEKLCSVQQEFGAGMLSHACSVTPRIISVVDGAAEKALTLSCPEAARHVLLNPHLLREGFSAEEGEMGISFVLPGDGNSIPAQANPMAHFWLIRSTVVTTLADRRYPLWERMFLLGLLCQRLDEIAAGSLKQPMREFLFDFERAVAERALRPTMQTLPVDHNAQLDAVLQLAGMLLQRSNILPRFVETVNAFTSGIGNGPGATLESLTAHYNEAHDHYFAPFFDLHPYVLENYLANTMLRGQFPFGRHHARPNAAPKMRQEFIRLTAQFALMKGLLIGVAGHHRENFSLDHVVLTMQAASKHFEHHPEFLKMAHELLTECRLDALRGMAILLRNTPAPEAQLPFAPQPQTSIPSSVVQL